jgi:hypothetical protein
MKFGVPIVDLTCGINLAFGITTALYNRSITNQVLIILNYQTIVLLLIYK